jgi:hypothetical protein
LDILEAEKAELEEKMEEQNMVNDEIQADIQTYTQATDCEACKETKVKWQFAQS